MARFFDKYLTSITDGFLKGKPPACKALSIGGRKKGHRWDYAS
jgi:hypothetical protein